jgi:hypothetical protein
MKKNSTEPLRPFCFGRDEPCTSIVRSSMESGSVLLFGGRQSGKSTVLRKISYDLGCVQTHRRELRLLQVPVYVDLLKLGHDGGPSEFFQMLATLAVARCKRQIQGLRLKPIRSGSERTGTPLDLFIKDLEGIYNATGNVDLRLIFLLDETKRVVGDRFPSGFRANLFSLLYGEPTVSGRCSFVFAGAQDLYQFCEIDMSPIGSRAATHLLDNLPYEAICSMVSSLAPALSETEAKARANLIYGQTGGQAGLSAFLARKSSNLMALDTECLAQLVKLLKTEHSVLFQLWAKSLSPEARVGQEVLLQQGKLEPKDMPRQMNKRGMDPYKSDRVRQELLFTGIAIRDGDILVVGNRIYADVVRDFVIEDQGTDLEQTAWSLIEEIELALRRLIRLRFEARWGIQADIEIRRALGDEAWAKIQENRSKSEMSYPKTPRTQTLDVLDFAYLSQLVQLMLWQKAWDMFKSMFRDKRELEDILRSISPVRNDQAHFRSVPERELTRCRLACEDLRFQVEQSSA